MVFSDARAASQIQRARTCVALGSVALAATLLVPRKAACQSGTTTAPSTSLAVASIFTDHMVLQRDMDIPVWGWADPGESVKVEIGQTSSETRADGEGRWLVRLDSMEAGGPHEVVISSGGESLTLGDVLIGDVWIASGQSNMEWTVAQSNDAQAEIAAANWPEIRAIDVPNQLSDAPRDSFASASWQSCSPETAGAFSAVAYYFGRALYERFDVPVGLVGCNWGGTPMEAWTSREALEGDPTFAPAIEAAEAPPKDDAAAAERRQRPQNQPAVLFNGMLSTVMPYGIRGVIWYQGESNAGRHGEYARLSKLMIADWRHRWGQGDFPFLLVQLAGWEPGGDAWPYLRQAQFETLEAPNTGMAVAIDIGDRTDIHPRNKQDVGARLALVARAVAYGEDVEFSGPVLRDVKAEGGKLRLVFDHVGAGLTARGDALKGFEIAGPEGAFVPADAAVDGTSVVASSAAIADPRAVRYNWAAYPDGNLYNVDGLPAVPFNSALGRRK